jgi:hypothetical protein
VVPVAAATTSVLSDEIGTVLAAWDLHVRVTARSPNHDGWQAFRGESAGQDDALHYGS